VYKFTFLLTIVSDVFVARMWLTRVSPSRSAFCSSFYHHKHQTTCSSSSVTKVTHLPASVSFCSHVLNWLCTW